MRVTTMATATEARIHIPGRDQAASPPALALALPEPRDRDPRADLERLRRARQDALRRADRRSPARDRAARDRDRARARRSSELIIRDNGIGMTHDELVTNLGTIAHSGSGEFLKSLSGEAEGQGRPVADRPVRRRVLLGVHDRRPGRGPDPELPRGDGLGVGVGGDRQLHGHARREPPAPRHRDHPAPQGRRQGFRRRPAHQGDRQALFELRPAPDPARPRARSSTTRSRSGSSPRAR